MTPTRSILQTLAIAGLLASQSFAGVGESAIITLVFPPGARATGLGEAFTGLSDDVNATYFNPAGLGQPPLANTWHVYQKDKGLAFTAIVGRQKKAFELREEIWAGTNSGVLRYNGRAWQSFEEHMVSEGDDLESIITRYFGETSDQVWMRSAMDEIKLANKIDGKRRAAIRTLLAPALVDSTGDSARVGSVTSEILALSDVDRTAARVFGLLSGKVDSLKADTLSDKVADILTETDDVDLADLVELKVPFSIAVRDTVTALAYDGSNQVWVGTPRGLWRYDGTSWKMFSSVDGLPSDRITCIAAGEYGTVAVGTDRGLALFTEGLWKRQNGLPDSSIGALTFGPSEALFVGTRAGLAQRKDSSWVTFDTATGLLSNNITALMLDDEGQLWIGSDNGVTLYDKVSWKRYKLPDSRVFCIAAYGKNKVWIGTDRGVLRYRPRRAQTDKQGNLVERPPEWKVFHSKNGLTGEVVRGIAVHGKDVWIATDAAINHYDNAERQVLSFYEQLLPAFNIDDLWHLYLAGVWPTEDWGTLGLTINYIHMGVNDFYDDLGGLIGTARSWEGVFGLSYGISLMKDFSLGLNVKYANSALAPDISGDGEGVGRTFAIDAALLKRNLGVRGLDLGFMFQNMGPSVFYTDESSSDPIPFNLRLGLGYRVIETPVHDLNIALDLYREFVHTDNKGNPDPFFKAIVTDLQDSTGDFSWQSFEDAMIETQLSLGMEYWYIQFLALRLGFLFDYIGERYELTFGLGLRYGAVNFDWSYIHSPEGMMKEFLQNINETKTGATGARHGQWRISLITRF